MTGPRVGSLFSGATGLEMGVRAVLGGTVAWHCEVDPGACKVLDHRYPDVPNLGDITAVDWSAVEPVDVIAGGSPCQDVSHAGKRAGMTEGSRSNLWVAMRGAIAALRPQLVIWENVRGAYSACADSEMGRCPRCVDPDSTAGHAPHLRALGRVVGDLSSLGFHVRWHGLRAADVGAPHGRFRVFVVATDARRADGQRWARAVGGSIGRRSPASAHERLTATASDAQGDGRDEGRPEPARLVVGGSDAAQRGRPVAPDAASERWAGQDEPQPVMVDDRPEPAHTRQDGRTVDWGPYRPAIERWAAILGRPAPPPTEPGPRGGQRLSPRLTEWMMGWPDGWVTDVPGLSRNDQLKICGNGCVPQQVAAAYRLLLARESVAA